jgi:N6-adenosine-specific RNA methylase IME4
VTALRLPARCEATPAGLVLPETLTVEDWADVGRALGRAERSVMWWIGDWWAFGDRYSRARTQLVRSDEWDGPSLETCRNAAVVAARFKVSRRRDTLGFTHHAEVAALPADDADALLDAAEAEEWSTRQLRAEVAKLRNAAAIGAPPASEDTCKVQHLEELVAKGRRFGCIYADPPWLYGNQGTRAATSNHYGGMTVDELCALPVRDLAAGDAHLHLWTTNAFLFACPRIFDAWGFEFRSSLVWVKPQMGIGNYWRNSHEFLLTAIRGNAKRFNDRSLKSWLEVDRGAHSAKPEQVRAMLERASPGPYLEMFARREARGWTVWGNQIEESLFNASAEAA